MFRKVTGFLDRRTRYAWSTALMVAAVTAVVLTLVSLPRVDPIFVVGFALVVGAAIGLFLDWRAYRRRQNLSREWEWVEGARVTVNEGNRRDFPPGARRKVSLRDVGGRAPDDVAEWAIRRPKIRAKDYLVGVATAVLEEARQNGVEFL